MLALALHLLLLTLLQLYHLPPLSLLQLVILLACSLVADPVCQMLPCTMVVFKVVYYEIKTFIFYLFLCEKYYKPVTVPCYIANYVSWLPRLTSLDL